MTDLIPTDKHKQALALIGSVQAMPVTSAAEHKAMELGLAEIRRLEATLEADYAAHPIVVQFRVLQAQKSSLAKDLEATRKLGKAKQIAYEAAEEHKRLAAEEALRAQMQKEAETQHLAIAAEMEKANPALAEAMLNEPVTVPTVILPKTAPKTRQQVRWDFRIVNADAIPRSFMMPDTAKIGQVVRAMKGSANIAGVEPFSRTV